MHDYLIGGLQGAALLDEGVERLLPTHFEPATPSPRDLVEIVNTGKKGFGMFARRDIPAQGLILIEHPIVITPYLLSLTTPLSNIYARLFNRLPPISHRELMRLANCKLPDECSVYEGIVRTNAIGIQLDVPDVPHPELTTHRAIFLNTSRCNHRFNRNPYPSFDPVVLIPFFHPAAVQTQSGNGTPPHFLSTSPSFDRSVPEKKSPSNTHPLFGPGKNAKPLSALYTTSPATVNPAPFPPPRQSKKATKPVRSSTNCGPRSPLLKNGVSTRLCRTTC